jgi:predicted hotdog family 3-hydroxylacyl-ACP dehydratase
MEFEQIDIRDLIPQKEPFIMVDKLLYCDMISTKTSLSVKTDNIFFDGGKLSASGLIENIAQTCAARMGYINLYINRDTVKLGFIGAIRNLEIFRLPQAGEQLVTQIKTLEEIFQMTLVEANIRVKDELLASCEMKISITDINKADE